MVNCMNFANRRISNQVIPIQDTSNNILIVFISEILCVNISSLKRKMDASNGIENVSPDETRTVSPVLESTLNY